jgi:hypothetical protein
MKRILQLIIESVRNLFGFSRDPTSTKPTILYERQIINPVYVPSVEVITPERYTLTNEDLRKSPALLEYPIINPGQPRRCVAEED